MSKVDSMADRLFGGSDALEDFAARLEQSAGELFVARQDEAADIYRRIANLARMKAEGLANKGRARSTTDGTAGEPDG